MYRIPSRKRKAFTLIELLIVVAIIGILAAIAVPNFLNAQVRAGVARVKADFRSINTAMQSYLMDNNAYPPDDAGPNEEDRSYKRLTTPIAYISSTEVFRDFFVAKSGNASDGVRNFYDYGQVPYIKESGLGYVIVSFAPDRKLNMPWNTTSMDAMANNDARNLFFIYESSNGLNSAGDLIATAHGIENK